MDSEVRDTSDTELSFYHPALETVRPKDLNNFFCNLPGGLYRSPSVLICSFNSNETFRGAFERFAKRHGKRLDITVFAGYSEKKLNQTPEQFFIEVDSAIERSRISYEFVERCVTRHAEGKDTPRVRNLLLEIIHKNTYPVYRSLREHGYTHRDLTG